MNKVKLGIVGLGRLGRKHAEDAIYKIPNAELIAVCSRTKEKTDAFADKWGIKYRYYDYEKMLENDKLDGIIIASSSNEHSDHAISALNSGFHVFCEKPLGLTMEECKLVEAAVKENKNKIFTLGFMNRFDKAYLYVHEKIKEGFLGKPILIRSYRLDPKEHVQSSIDYAPKSGGLFFDVGVHDIDIARWLISSEPKSIFSMGGCYAYEEFKDFNDIDNGSIAIQFQNDVMGYFYMGRTCVEGYHIETEIIGTEGSLKIGALNEHNPVTIFNEAGAIKEFPGWFLERYEDALLNEKQDFVNCILEDRRPEVTVYDGIKATEICNAAKESLEKNMLIRFPNKN